MKKIQLAQIDAFTDTLFGGNPASVVVDANALDETDMRHIANEMNLAETAFVLPSEQGDFRLRYFNPYGAEIRFCGHGSVGALYELARKKLFGMGEPGQYSFRVETLVGVIPMHVTCKKDGKITVSFQAPTINLRPTTLLHTEIAEAFGINANIIDMTKPIMRELTNDFVYFTVKSLKALGEINYDFQKAKAFSEEKDIMLFYVVTAETFDPAHNVHSRSFAPRVGLFEDPVTGAAQGGLVAYLLANKMISSHSKKIVSEQGHFMQRPGFVEIEIQQEKGELSVTIHANAVPVFSTELFI